MSLSKVSLCQENLKVKVIIFNHTEFKNDPRNHLKRHPGIGDKFEQCMRTLLEYCAEISHIKKNEELEASNILNFMKKVSVDGNRYSGLVVFVSSHGNIRDNLSDTKYEVIRAHDKYYKKSDLWNFFSSKKEWEGKPLLFFYQACRGDDATIGTRMSIDSSAFGSSVQLEQLQNINIRNLFILNATQPGAVAFKNEAGTASYFVDKLCESFTEHAKNTDVCSMAVKICKAVSEDFEFCPTVPVFPSEKHDCSVQMPCFESNLEMKLYLKKQINDEPELSHDLYYTSNDNPIVLFLNYSEPISETDRINNDTKLLETFFSNKGYDCRIHWNVNYGQYTRLLNDIFDHSSKSGFIIIFNGCGEYDTFQMDTEHVNLPDLWKPLLPIQNIGNVVEKPKVLFFLGKSTKNCSSGTNKKFSKLYNIPENTRNVQVCKKDLPDSEANIPITADLLLCFQNAFEGELEVTPFVKAFCEQAEQDTYKDYLEILMAVNHQLKLSQKETVLFFSTVRKLIPIS